MVLKYVQMMVLDILVLELQVAFATSTPVVTHVTGLETWKQSRGKEFHGNLVSWNCGILYNKCSNVFALVGKWICVLSLNIA